MNYYFYILFIGDRFTRGASDEEIRQKKLANERMMDLIYR